MRAVCLVIVSFLVLSLQSVSPAQTLSPTPMRGSSIGSPCTDLNQVAVLFYQGKTRQEILNAWSCYVKQNPRINVAAALESLQQQVKQIGEDRVQKARIRVGSTGESEDTARTDYQQAVQTLAAIQKAMYDNAMTILSNLKS